MNRMACALAFATGTGLLFGPSATSALAEPMPFAASGLQIAVAASNATSDAASSLDVTFKGGAIESIELYLDGYLIKKQALHTREGHGVINFSLDGISEGAHEVLIKAFDADGNSATGTAKWKVAAADADVLARFVGLKPNQQIQGVLPIQVKVDDSVHSPYVTFLIDNDFLAFMNYAPFAYNWDTSKVSNGAHTIGVDIYDGETTNKVKSLTMQINVNNPGGFTKINRDPAAKVMPDKPKTGATASDITAIARGVAESALPNVSVAPQSAANLLSRLGLNGAAKPELRPGHAPKSSAFGGVTKNIQPAQPTANANIGNAAIAAPLLSDAQNFLAPDTTTGGVSHNSLVSRLFPSELRAAAPGHAPATASVNAPNTDILPIAPAVRPAGTYLLPKNPGVRNVEPTAKGFTRNVNPVAPTRNSGVRLFTPGTLGELASPSSLLTAPNAAEAELSHVLLRARHAGNVAARPGFALRPANVLPTVAHTTAALAVAHPAPKAKVVVTKKAELHKRKPGLFATFDNAPVDFDVPTRTQGGIALTPFRQIFEHTGGEVGWYEKTQTVRAANKTTAIQIQIGNRNAKVNNKNVKMESKPFVEKGRTIVPISFLKDAMNVKVHYDEKTGHLLIESNK